jgi:transcriptional regulator with XRE-family HTH domain
MDIMLFSCLTTFYCLAGGKWTMTDICADRLRQARERAGVSQRELARRLNVSQQSIAQHERGQRLPRPERLRALAVALQVSCDFLVGLEDDDSELLPAVAG